MNTMIDRWIYTLAVLGVVLLLAGCNRPPPGTFETPEQAIQAMADVIGTHDTRRIEQIFGPGSVEMFESGDEDADRENGERVKAMIAAGVAFEDYDDHTKIALLGDQQWPVPIPLVQENGRWRFDTANGREELLNRRIGHNELATLSTLHEIVEAQREYFAAGRDGNPPAYAQRFLSTEDRQDGLYWPSEDGAEPSPLGDLLADSEITSRQGPQPFQGYFYRMLKSQGSNAPGGAKDYVGVEGLMQGGFAVIAWPAKYANSGVMSFQMNQRGIVYQKDLGADTETAAAAITAFDPDASWTPTGDTDVDEEDDEAEPETEPLAEAEPAADPAAAAPEQSGADGEQ